MKSKLPVPTYDPRLARMFEALLQVAPALEGFREGANAADLESPEFILSVIGRRARFRRLGFTRLRARTGSDFAADPYVEALLWFDLGLCQLVSYQDEFIHLDLSRVSPRRGDMVYRIVFSLLNDLAFEDRVLTENPLSANLGAK